MREVVRAVTRKHEGRAYMDYLQRSLQYLDMTMMDPKNASRVGELEMARVELLSFFGIPTMFHFNTNESEIIRYWEQFASLV